MNFSIRTLGDEEYRSFADLVATASNFDPVESDADRTRALYDLDRVHGVFDDGELIGTAAVLTRAVTVPGGGVRPVAAVTGVGVKHGHRRRGVLSALMRTQFHGLHDGGREPFAALWASEASIYGRYGYGVAAQYASVQVPRGAAFRPGVDVGDDRVREVPRDEAMPAMRSVYERVAPTRTGYLSRTDATWAHHFADEEHHREGMSAYRYALHPGGYAVYRIKNGWNDRGPGDEVTVRELVAEDDRAHAALHRYLLDLDLVSEVHHSTASDDPVWHLLANPRLATRRVADSLWVRIVDLDRALVARSYQSDVDVVLHVTDDRCPWNADRWRFTAEKGEAVVRRVTDEPDVALDISALGAAFLGGTRLSTLARAQYLRELTPGAVDALSRAFLGDRDPHCPELF
ncbi:GNAT family N-acetyltransferase [Umezawaea sp.]|uniref:GNAT family N-acetyltransferase n=1 Tax=Umezawaea sp. TaxID=1955258 RepID=UPI002ED41A5B